MASSASTPLASPPRSPHFEKLQATLVNEKLPKADGPRIQTAIGRYHQWIGELAQIVKDASVNNSSSEDTVGRLVKSLSTYRQWVDLELIFDSPEDFLYRQKGQLKLDNSIIEEFLIWLVNPVTIPGFDGEKFRIGPTNCFSAVYFEGSLLEPGAGAGIRVRTKDQDFALSRKLYLRASHRADFAEKTDVDTYIAYAATEVKTNLDKTMFQEACATARDLRTAVPPSRYYLMCEWLDMTPVSTATTDVEEVLILRGKRLGSHVRQNYSDRAKRQALRTQYQKYLEDNPFRPEIFNRWLGHLRAMWDRSEPIEEDVLSKGYF